ncbi:hypothetical protein D3C81_1895320 [compost metagenome]
MPVIRSLAICSFSTLSRRRFVISTRSLISSLVLTFNRVFKLRPSDMPCIIAMTSFMALTIPPEIIVLAMMEASATSVQSTYIVRNSS